MQPAPVPANVAEALSMLDAALDHLNAADWGSLPTEIHRQALTGLGRAEAKQTAARTAALAAFDAASGYTADGHGGPVPWLRGVTRITKPAAQEQAGWPRRLHRHPRLGKAMTAGWLSPSWAKLFATWNDRL
ncbi:MAG TPA: hypothetical protein VF482_01545, partial [Trebonia sp.]